MDVLKFTKTHEWVKIKEGSAVVGITDYAQHQLGDIVFIELPPAGSKLDKASQLGTLESTKAAVEIYIPLSGEVKEVNNEVINNPQWINQDPFNKGWMVKIKIEKPEEIEQLLDESAYKEFIEKETH